MKKIIEKIIASIKNESFKFDDNITSIILFSELFFRMIALGRGQFKGIGLKKRGSLVFIGKNVRLRQKRCITLGSGVTLDDYSVLEGLSKEGIIIGDNVKIGSYSQIKCTGSLKKIGKGFKIGKNSGVGDFCFFGSAGGIEIGKNVIMGQNVRFHSENHNYNRIDLPIKLQGVTSKGIKVGNDCWIGAGAVFLDGVNVGEGCVIGANALINKSLPPYSVAVGNPVKIIKNRKDLM